MARPTQKQDIGHGHHLPAGTPHLHTAHGIEGINPEAKPSSKGCVDCLNMHPQGGWLHLRRCAECGHVGCCNSSPNDHAQKHFEATGHPIIQSFEPGEDWFYSYITRDEVEVPANLKLAEPTSHPHNQPVPFGNWVPPGLDEL